MVGFEPYLKLFDKVRAVTKSARYAFFYLKLKKNDIESLTQKFILLRK